jgi:hypothetical protein
MRLHLLDLQRQGVCLTAARALVMAHEHLSQVTNLPADTGYHHRDAEIAALAQVPSARPG